MREPFAANRAAVVHEADVGAVAAAVLLDDHYAGQALPITGLGALTVPERVAVLAAATGRQIRYEELTVDRARERELLVSWLGDPPPAAYTVTDAVERVTGRPPRTFGQWAEEHAAAFR